MNEWAAGSPVRTSSVGVRVPADLSQLTMLRALAETVALIADFALDEVTDIRVALDEIATALIAAAVPGSELDCDFGYDDGAMTVRVAAVADVEDALDEDGFGWHVLRTITRTLEARTEAFDAARRGYPVTVEFCRARGGADDG
ncbi:serine/threonine-protein kinase RsbW [Nocardia transvalensis]|uniref:Serine/threonine-protein kinase RsbW n=1 Tax=Nocardia transvalensis TaxID=37333 RepID=A0A7W9PJF5_9NOCA|nr:anti-sigma factor [Nocardia transvalensis]MBB5917287.1 serine/threonine-protein kinase RsbW [Nocardia transvalensis]